jgi:hypothetical protein
MEVEVKYNQSIIDIAIEHLGSAEMALDIALLNGISITDVLVPGTSLLLPEVRKTINTEALPVVAPVTEASLLGLLTAHTAIMGGAVAGHVRNGGNVSVDGAGRMWVTFPEYVTNWDDIEGIPSTFPPSAHSHGILHTKTLTVAEWENKQQSVSVAGVTDNNKIYVSPSNLRANFLAYGLAQVSVISQSLDTLTFECSTVPTIELTVNIEVV